MRLRIWTVMEIWTSCTQFVKSTTEDDKIVWYENVDGIGNFGPPQVITTLATRANVHAADLDGDGDVDVLSFSDR